MLASSSCVPSYVPPPGTLFSNVSTHDVRWYHGPPGAGEPLAGDQVVNMPVGTPVAELCALDAGCDTAEHYIYVILPSGCVGRRVWSVFTAQLIQVIA